MQYLSGVWESLTGQATAKRKRSGNESAALPDRMTSLKLFSDQCPGRQQSSATYSRLPEDNLLDSSSCATSGSYFRPPGSFSTSDDCFGSGPSFCQQAQDPTFRLPPPVHSHDQPQGSISNHTGSNVRYSSQPSYTDFSQHHHFVPHALKSTKHTFLQAQQHRSFTAAVQSSLPQNQSASSYYLPGKQTEKHSTTGLYQKQPAAPATSTDLFCSESISPEACCKPSPVCADVQSPDLDLTESVADSPNDNDIMDEIMSSPSTPISGVLMAFLALCQSPQVITALSKLQASHLLPCPSTFSVLPLSVQLCPEALSTELLTAGSLVQQWSKASQLEWTLAGMFALSQRAGLDPMDLDTTRLLSLLWILESCSSQYNSNLTVITSNYLAYTNVAAALAGPSTPAQIRRWQQDMKASQLELLKRCEWRIHMDLGTDVVPALQQMQQADAMPKLQSVLRQIDAESRHRRAMDVQLQAHRRQQASQAQQAQQLQHAQHVQAAHAQYEQQAFHLACCQSSTKPPKPRANSRNDQSSQRARLRQEAEDLHQSSLNGKYWQTGSSTSHTACPQHETLIPLGQRARNRAVRTKLSW